MKKKLCSLHILLKINMKIILYAGGLIVILTHCIQGNSVLTGKNPKTEIDMLRQMLNQETLMRMEFEKKLKSLTDLDNGKETEWKVLSEEIKSLKNALQNVKQETVSDKELATKNVEQNDAFKKLSNICTYELEVFKSNVSQILTEFKEKVSITIPMYPSDKIKNKLQLVNIKSSSLIRDGYVPIDCSDIHLSLPHFPDDVYRIYPSGGTGILVYCDMTIDGGGWTVFQRRKDGSENFFRGWNDYKNGFGNITGEHWLGNELLHEITRHGLYELRIDLGDFEGETRFAKYNVFSVSNEEDGYRIKFDGYTGTAGNSMSSNNAKFTTKDRDNDNHSKNCAKDFSWKGAWWFDRCFSAHLNGIYHNSSKLTKSWTGLMWENWHGSIYSLKTTSMMFRKHN